MSIQTNDKNDGIFTILQSNCLFILIYVLGPFQADIDAAPNEIQGKLLLYQETKIPLVHSLLQVKSRKDE